MIGDFKNIRRDPTLLVLLFVPFILLILLRIVIPLLTSYYPDLSLYYPVVIALFGLLNASFPGFIVSFILLDEKDLHLLQVIKVTPVSLSGFLLVRLIYMSVIGFLTGFMIIRYNGFYHLSPLESIELSILCMLNAPILLLSMATLAKNKVEGLTYMKAANILLLLPVAVLFITTPYENMLALFPAFWVYKFFDVLHHRELVFVLGTLCLSGYNILVYRYACRQGAD